MLYARLMHRVILATPLIVLAASPAAGQAVEGGHDAVLEQARRALEGGDPGSAFRLLDGALRARPDDPRAFEILGSAYQRLGQHENAVDALSRAIELGGPPASLPALYLHLSESLDRLDRTGEAIDALRELITLFPATRGAHLKLGHVLLAIGKLESAAEEFRKEIALPPAGGMIAAAREGLGVAAYRLGDDDAALEALRDASDTILARYHVGLSRMRRGEYEEAAEALRAVLERDPDHRGALQNLARCDAALGLHEERREVLDRFGDLYREEEKQKALQVRIRSVRNRGKQLGEAGDAAGAAQALEEAADLAPDDVEVLIDLGWRQFQAGDLSRSEEVFRRILELDPLTAEAHYGIGRIRARSGDLAGAVESMSTAIRLNPLSASQHTFLGQLHFQGRRMEEGLGELRLARRLDPGNPEGAFNLGVGLAQTGALSEAASELEAAVALGYDRPQIHDVLSRIYGQLGDSERSAIEREKFERLTRSPAP